MTNIVMLLSNAFRPDPRVLKEAQGIAERGYHVSIICWDRAAELPSEEIINGKIKVIRIRNIASSYGIGARQLLRLPRFWKAAISIINLQKPDLIHCHDFDTLPAGLWWGKRHRVPVIYDAHEYYADMCRPRLTGIVGHLLYLVIKLSERIGTRLASAVITVDDFLGAIFHRYNHRVTIIGHYPPAAMAKNEHVIFLAPQLTLLYIGRISTDRGMLIYLEILKILVENSIPARLKLAGIFTPAKEEQDFLLASKGLEEHIELLGWVPFNQLIEVLESADIGLVLLQPETRYQVSIPVKLFEYMAGGLAVIASNFPQIVSIVEETRCGKAINPISADPAVEQIIAWWNNRENARQLGEHGRQAILDKYNWETLMHRLDELYQAVLTNH